MDDFEDEILSIGRELEDDIKRVLDEGVEKGVRGAVEYVWDHHRYKDRTGTLTNSIAARTLGEAEAEIVAKAPYAGYVEEGTHPHDIEAHGSGMLVWEPDDAPGDVHRAKIVHHPGTPAAGFMGDAYRKCEEIATAAIEQGLVDVARKVERR